MKRRKVQTEQDVRDHDHDGPLRIAVEPGRGPAVRSLHPSRLPMGLSTVNRIEAHRRPKKVKAPKSETLVYHAYTGMQGLAWGNSIGGIYNPPVQPWDAYSKFYDWNEQCIPNYWQPTNAEQGATKDLDQVVCHNSLVPKFDQHGTPSWPTSIQYVRRTQAGVPSLTNDPDQDIFQARVDRLQVNGSHYQIHMNLQGIIRYIGGSFNTVDERPISVRIMAFQYTEDDTDTDAGNSIVLGTFYRNLPDAHIDVYPPEITPWARRITEEDKQLNGWDTPPYKILVDKSIPFRRPDGSVMTAVPFNIDFGPINRFYTEGDVVEETTTNAVLPDTPVAPSNPSMAAGRTSGRKGRIFWGIFHNVVGQAPYLEYAKNPTLCFDWYGKWSFSVKDGNF